MEKTLKYTLIGGFVGLTSFIVIYLLVNVVGLIGVCWGCFIILDYISFPCSLLGLEGIPCLLISGIVWFGVGILIGWIISKIWK